MDPTKCDAPTDSDSPYGDCVPLTSEIIKTRNVTSALKCYSVCRIEQCYSFKFANGLCTIKLYAGEPVDFSQNVVAGSFISCYNENFLSSPALQFINGVFFFLNYTARDILIYNDSDFIQLFILDLAP
ncbi:uncharacterized protein LOC131945948 [Physella acuta]|uniref:uncharacterized protein LOC131945948 n=1 Tax=Physella acuta TaxID=109671 RepID=UPI0027DB1854|nr:uncharacterized protein LOC131945948 [Physella acuta]